MIAVVVVVFSQPNTRTATRVTALATPYVAPPTVPAVCVPCPLQSCVLGPLSTVLTPGRTRPPKSTWVARMPVSMMYAFTPDPVAVYV